MARFPRDGMVRAVQLLAAIKNEPSGGQAGRVEVWRDGAHDKGVLCLRIESPAAPDFSDPSIRTRILLASLLPALFLVASVQCLLDCPAGSTGGGATIVVAGASHDQHAPVTFRRGERSSWRRVAPSSGPAGFPPASPALESRVLKSGFSEVLHLAQDGPLGLAKCWQFHWRTALEPRAPSSVS